MLTNPRLKNTDKERRSIISKDIKICLECGSKNVEELEFAISCEDCGILLLRG